MLSFARFFHVKCMRLRFMRVSKWPNSYFFKLIFGCVCAWVCKVCACVCNVCACVCNVCAWFGNVCVCVPVWTVWY